MTTSPSLAGASSAAAFDAAVPPGSSTWARRALLVAAALLVATHGAAIGAMFGDSSRPQIALTVAEGAVYAVAVWLVVRRQAALPLWAILAVAGVLRLSVLFLDPYYSTDIYRYVWEGRIQAAGFSPYLHVPADPALFTLRDDAVWRMINRADYAPTIYPPVAQAIFFLATRVAETVTWMKIVLVAFEALAVWALVRLLDLESLPRARILIYAWCPLPVWEFASAGHVDAAMIAFVLLALLASRLGRDSVAGAALGAAVLVKFLPLVLVPALWRRWDRKLPVALGATLFVAYLPHFLVAGPRVVGFLPTYAAEEGIRDASGFWLARFAKVVSGAEVPALLFVGLAALALAGIGLFVATRPVEQWRRPLFGGGLALAATAMMALSPNYPWYFAWLLPFLCFFPSWPLIWLVVASPFLYWDNPRSALWIPDLVYGGTFALFLASFAARAIASALPRTFAPSRNAP